MDWNDCILLKTKDKKTMVVPRSAIKYAGSRTERNYSTSEPKEFEQTVVHIEIEWALNAGLDVKYSQIRDKVVGLDLDMELKVLLGLLRGDKAAEVLF